VFQAPTAPLRLSAYGPSAPHSSQITSHGTGGSERAVSSDPQNGHGFSVSRLSVMLDIRGDPPSLLLIAEGISATICARARAS
jgi:hypothetical protein